jgi:heptosyltransferase-1
MSDVLFIKTSSLGDVIHHMPAVTEVKRRRPDVRIAWVVEENYAPLAALHPAVAEVIPVAVRRWRRRFVLWASWRDARTFVKQLRSRSYDAVIDTQGLVRSAILARLARGRRHGYDAESVRERAAAFAYDVAHSVPRGEHAVARNRVLTALALGYTVEGAPDFGLDREKLAGVTRAPYAIFLHATAQKGKEWPEENWLALAKALEGETALLLPFGSQAEQARAERLASQLANTRVPIARPIDDMARLIAGASFVVGVDTGILHLAAALGVPVVGIFCGSEPSLTGPVGPGRIEVVGSKGVVPSVEQVLAAAARVTA